jgi:hypothetical protein
VRLSSKAARAGTPELVDGPGKRLGRRARVQPFERREQPAGQLHLALGLAAQRGGRVGARAEGLLLRRHRLPTELVEQPDGGLLDELVFGVGVGGHGDVLVPSGLGAARV